MLAGHLEKRLAQATVHGPEMELTDNHGQAGPCSQPVHHLMVGLDGIAVEAHDVEMTGTDGCHLLVHRMGI